MIRTFMQILSLFLAGSLIGMAAPRPQQGSAAGGKGAAAAQSSAAPKEAAAKQQDAAGLDEPSPDAGKAKRASELGLFAAEAEDWEGAFEHFSEAVEYAPGNKGFLFQRELARSRLVREYSEHAERDALAGRLDMARGELLTALALVPGDQILLERLKQFEAMEPTAASEPATLSAPIELKPQEVKKSFHYRGDVMGAYREVAQAYGLVVEFDPELGLHGAACRWQADDVDFYTAMRLLGAATKTFWNALNPHIFFVASDTPEKRRDFEPVGLRTIPLRAAANNEQMTEDQRVVRDIVGITRVALDTSSHALTIKAPAEQMKIAAELIDSLDQPPGELVLEVNVLEADRNVATQLGISPPTSATIFTLSKLEVEEAQQSVQGLINVLTQVFGQPSSLGGISTSQIGSLVGNGQLSVSSLIPPLLAFGGGATTFLYTLPGAVANFANALTLVRSGQRVQMRAQDNKMATFFVGDRYPITLGQYGSSLVGGASIPAVTSQTFPTNYYAAGTNPVSVVAADFNNDGFQDLAVADKTTNMLSILLNAGNGTFGAATMIPTGNTPVALAAGDFNSDGNMDLAVVNQADATVTILLGNGDGTFTTMTGPVTVVLPTSIAVADFNSDGIEDLVVTNGTSNTVSVFLGNGDGTFQPKADYGGGAFPISVTVADFNGDTHPDLAVVNFSANTVSIFLNTGTGTFGARTDYPTGFGPVAVAAADFNLDGLQDLAVVNQTDGTVSVYLGVGNGALGLSTPYFTGNGPAALSIGDFNIDGLPDIAVANMTDNTVAVLLNGGAGTFVAPLTLPVGSQPVYVTTADFNNDGSPDLVLADYGSGDVAVILNTLTSFAPGTAQGQTPFPNSEYEDLGLKIHATPRIHPDGEVTLEMKIEIKSLSGSSINQIPIISNRSFEQTVRLRQDETTAIAGILQDNEMRSITGNPGIATLPHIGDLLSSRTLNDQGTDLLILITPRLVRQVPHTDRVIYAGHDKGVSGPIGLPFGRPGQFPLPPQQPGARIQQ